MSTCTACHLPTDKILSVDNRELCEPCAAADYRPCSQCEQPVNIQDEMNVTTDAHNSIYCDTCAVSLVECTECGKTFPADEITEIDGDDICDECRDENYTKCNDCRTYKPNDEITEIDGDDICDECRDENYTQCARCNDYVKNDDTARIRDVDEIWCQSCTDNYATQCHECSDYIRDSYTMGRLEYCESCASDLYECHECGTVISDDNSYYDEDDGETYCERCFNNINRDIQGHGYKPAPKFIGKHLNPLYYIGIELETENNPDDIAKWVNENYGDKCYCKEDGSLNDGVEIVTHPIAENYPHANFWRDILKNIKRLKGSSYKSGNCGIHIHISKKYFSSLHLYKLMKFIYENPKFILLISQRAHEHLRRWASPYPESDNTNTIVYKAKNKSGNRNRYVALNLQNDKTIEFRIFRGTLKLESFLKNIEFVRSIIAWTKDVPLAGVNKAQYLNFIQINATKYYNLCNFLSHKGEF